MIDSDCKEVNSYSETVLKKLRNLKKKLLKIEKYETLSQEELNQDQILLIKQKSFVVSVIKELEDLNSHFLTLEESDKIRRDKLEEIRNEEIQEIINNKVQEARKIPKENLKKLLRIIGILQERLEYAEFYLSAKDFKVLTSLAKELVTEGKGPDLALGLVEGSASSKGYKGYSWKVLVEMIDGLKTPGVNSIPGSKMSFFVEDSSLGTAGVTANLNSNSTPNQRK
jgi:hypothetical protein